MNPLFNFTLRDTFRVLFRHKYRAAIVVCGLLGLTLAALVMMPRTYESEAKLFVRVGNETMSVDPSVNPDKSISVQVAREEEIKSLIDLFRSHSVAEEVVARLGADVVVRQSFEPPKEPGQIDKWIDSAMGVVAKAIGSADVTIEERATRVVVESIRISAQPKSTVVQLAAEAATPQFAQKLAETYVDAMLDKHVQAHRTAQTLPFFEQQADALKLQVDEATKQLQHLKNHFGLVSVEGQKTIVEGQISSIEREILNAQTDMQAYGLPTRSDRRGRRRLQNSARRTE
ncbi:MAG: hypothetical protein QGG36_17980 [Pirellulaceae bacterium]|nr:hypothetical protein [Pirellulaceae bacterium]